MKYIPPKFERISEMSAIDVGRLTEDEARGMLEHIRWAKGIVCPHCESTNIVRIEGKATKVRDGLLRCKECRKQFTVTVGTVMERSHITLRQWVQAFYSMCSHKKGVSALQLQRNLGLGSYRSAWHLAHRIRAAMAGKTLTGMLHGEVQVDETYIGGKPRFNINGKPNKRGRGTKKTPVMVLVERNGEAVSKPIERVDGDTLKSAIREVVGQQSTIMTDDSNCYRGIGREFAGGHQFVNHSTGEYARGDVTTNTAESYFALLKRGVQGTFHHISKQHISRYCDEFCFRWNHRTVNDGERAEAAIMGADGKRLTYKKAVC